MTQRVIVDYPPNFDAIDAMFHVRNRPGVIFSFGPVIYTEYRWLVENGNRTQRRSASAIVSQRLASPIYGRMVGRSAAEAMLRAGAAP